jgi:hypothetical protein
VDHRLKIRWGEWSYADEAFKSEGHKTMSLWHIKRDAGDTHWISVEITPPCRLDYGIGESPRPFREINVGWVDERGLIVPLLQLLELAVLSSPNFVEMLIGPQENCDS